MRKPLLPGTRVCIQEGPLKGVRAQVIREIEDDEGVTVELFLTENFRAWKEGDELAMHPHSLEVIP